jgi:hypothetical protein
VIRVVAEGCSIGRLTIEVPLFKPSTVISSACPALPFVPLELPFVAEGILKCESIE